MRSTLTVVTFAAILAASTAGQNSTENVFGRCILPLGMEEGKIPDDAITASSSYETKSVGPQNARIRQEKNGGAWCPKAQISSAIREYLEIDLTRDHLIAWTETQGRFGNGQGQEYAEAFFLEYWRDEKWHHYKNLRGERVLRGNSNTYLVEKQKLELPFVASRVRFVPYSQHPRTVCMRVEIYGCLWQQHVRSYSAPKGSSLGLGGWDLQDSSYDGEEVDSRLANGLGQLTDGIVGQASDLLTSPTSDTGRASPWVGWSNRDTLSLTFRFQQLREFENCSVYAARIPHLQVQTFSTLRIWFSVDGEKYQSDAEKLESSIDPSSAVVDTVSASIPLQSRVGRVVKLEFSLAAKWLLLSEITFHTGSRNRSTDPDGWVDRSFEAERNQSESESGAKSSSSLDSRLDFNETELYEESDQEVSTPDAFPVGTSQTYVGLVSGLLTVFVLFLTCTAFLLKQRGRNKVALLQKHTALLCDSSAPAIPIAPKDAKLSTSIVTGLSLIRKPIAIAASDGGSDPPDGGSPTGFQPALLSHLDDPRRSSLYEATYRVFSHQNLQLAESSATARPLTSSADFARNSSFATSKSAEFTAAAYSTKKPAPHLQSANPAQKIHEGYYAATDILTVNLAVKYTLPEKRPVAALAFRFLDEQVTLQIKKRESPASSSPFTPLQIREKGARLPRSIETCNVRCVSRHRLRILDKLGEGNFGLVHLCEAKGIPIPEGGAIQNRQIVIVRSLWRGVVDSLRSDFAKDMRALGMLQHSNVAKVVALVEEEPFGAVFEYGQFGDLPSFLESSDVEDVSSTSRALNFVLQIASGMRYLESLNIAHCDLAARNCIVGRDLTIKVSDHAVYCAKYDHHYFVDGHNAKIPIRWMAWEAALLGKRSCQADVWSFAVTVWEIFLNCKETPYADLTVPQVLENCGRWYRSAAAIGSGSSDAYDDDDIDDSDRGGRNQPRILSQPDRCPDQLYRAMAKCWSKRIEDRPTFQQIYLYLESFSLD